MYNIERERKDTNSRRLEARRRITLLALRHFEIRASEIRLINTIGAHVGMFDLVYIYISIRKWYVRTYKVTEERTEPLNASRFKKVIKQRCVCIGIVTRAVQVLSQGLIFRDRLLFLLFENTCNLIEHLCHLNPFQMVM